jgi:phosphohistidine phosphatase
VRLYLVRHAIAEVRGPDWPDDTQRPLTRQGRQRMRRAARGLRDLGVELDVILTSPLVRARQTADILVRRLTPKPVLVETSSLAPGQPHSAVLRALEPYRRARAVALVGHEPDLGMLAAFLLGAPQPLVFGKGGVCCCECPKLPPDGDVRLLWHATPRMLRRMGE